MLKKILTGINTFSNNWLLSIEKIKKENLIIKDFLHVNFDIEMEQIDYILPLGEKDYNIIISKNINPCKILYPNNSAIEILHNKIRFAYFMLENFPNNIPQLYYLENKQINNNISFPVIIKPRYSTNGNNMHIILNKKKLSTIKDKTIVQKYIEDIYEYGIFMLCINGKIINHKVIRGIFTSKYNIKKTNFIKYEVIKDFPIDIFKKIIDKLNYTGGCNIDFKYLDGIIYIFEINPRFGGTAFTSNFFYELICF